MLRQHAQSIHVRACKEGRQALVHGIPLCSINEPVRSALLPGGEAGLRQDVQQVLHNLWCTLKQAVLPHGVWALGASASSPFAIESTSFGAVQ